MRLEADQLFDDGAAPCDKILVDNRGVAVAERARSRAVWDERSLQREAEICVAIPSAPRQMATKIKPCFREMNTN